MAPRKKGKKREEQRIRHAEKLKSNKPQVEQRRRERINSCLDQLKSLVLKATQEEVFGHDKMEKADVLEMTVNHLQKMIVTQPNVPDGELLTEYRKGFTECVQEVTSFLQPISDAGSNMTSELLQQIKDHLQRVTTFPSELDGNDSNRTEHDLTRPLHIDIPAGGPGKNVTSSLSAQNEASSERSSAVKGDCAIQVLGALQIIPANLLPTHATLFIPVSSQSNIFYQTHATKERTQNQAGFEKCELITSSSQKSQPPYLPSRVWRPW